MTQDAPMPDDLQQWVSERLPDVATCTDVSWPRANSKVWRIAAGSRTAYVKLSRNVEHYTNEVRGYQYAARVLTPDEAPQLLAVDRDLRAIMTSALPGRVVRGLPLEAAEERQVHRLAGRLLRKWHDHSAPATGPGRDAIMASVINQAGEAATCLDNTAGLLNDRQHALVQQVSQELPELAEHLPTVYRHGDYSTRNWLWDPQHGHGLFDFEQSAHGIAVEEFVWLRAAVWVTRPDLEAAFLTGYGRQLTEAEARALPLFAARLGVSYFSTGVAKQRLDLS